MVWGKGCQLWLKTDLVIDCGSSTFYTRDLAFRPSSLNFLVLNSFVSKVRKVTCVP